MTREAPAQPQMSAPVVPRHAGSGPLTSAQMPGASVRIAREQLAALVQDLGPSPPAVHQAACQALAALLELQVALRGEP